MWRRRRGRHGTGPHHAHAHACRAPAIRACLTPHVTPCHAQPPATRPPPAAAPLALGLTPFVFGVQAQERAALELEAQRMLAMEQRQGPGAHAPRCSMPQGRARRPGPVDPGKIFYKLINDFWAIAQK